MIYIITGPSHCGKSTYINKNKKINDQVIDILNYQRDCNDTEELLNAQYEFYSDIERLVRENSFSSPDYNLWIEGCFSNPARIGQIIYTVQAAGYNGEIQVEYMLSTREAYYDYLDAFEAAYAEAQEKATVMYDSKNCDIVSVGIIYDYVKENFRD
jgi:hypothetical protein